MTNLRPRKVAHKGRVEAAGFLFNAALVGVAELLTERAAPAEWGASPTAGT